MWVESKPFIEVDEGDERGALVDKEFDQARSRRESRSEREEERGDDMRDRGDP